MNKVAHALITLAFGAGCWFLWAMLTLTSRVMWKVSARPPMYTQLCVGLRWVAVAAPLVAAGYLLYVCFRKHEQGRPWNFFFAVTTTALLLLLLPVLVAVWLPMVQFMENAAAK